MEFKSRTALAQHFKELEKEGWVTSEWIEKDHPTQLEWRIKSRVFKINFSNIPTKETSRDATS